MLVDIIAKEKKPRQKGTQLARGGIRRRNSPQLHDDLVSRIEIFQLLVLVPSIGAYSALLYDALLIALNRQPLFLPTALASYRRLEMDQRRALKPFRR